mmetsp:Transcript_28718/g.73024  ORF Transcript_28718/g.73024 Transcript_28718/m.73024 type:complete len:390 (-) Transcript_28718:1151-2320(-)
MAAGGQHSSGCSGSVSPPQPSARLTAEDSSQAGGRPGGGCATRHLPDCAHSKTYTRAAPASPWRVMSTAARCPGPALSTQRVDSCLTNTRRVDRERRADATCCTLSGNSPLTTPTCALTAECAAATNSRLRSVALAAARPMAWEGAAAVAGVSEGASVSSDTSCSICPPSNTSSTKSCSAGQPSQAATASGTRGCTNVSRRVSIRPRRRSPADATAVPAAAPSLVAALAADPPPTLAAALVSHSPPEAASTTSLPAARAFATASASPALPLRVYRKSSARSTAALWLALSGAPGARWSALVRLAVPRYSACSSSSSHCALGSSRAPSCLSRSSLCTREGGISYPKGASSALVRTNSAVQGTSRLALATGTMGTGLSCDTCAALSPSFAR